MREVGAYEAKTNLPRLLDEVERGDSITITRRGVPVAVLAPVGRREPRRIEEALARLDAIRSRSRPGPESIEELIDEGRRC